MNGARRLLLSGVVVTALLALVAVASRAHKPGGGTGGGGAHFPTVLAEYASVMALVFMLITAVVVSWVVAEDRHRRKLEGKTNWRRTLVSLGILAAILALAVSRTHWLHLHRTGRPAAGQIGAGRPTGTRTDGGHQRNAVQQVVEGRWLTALVLGSILVGVVIAGGLAARQRRLAGDQLEEEAALARALDEVLADTLDDLRAERDPRRAVIEAYARMEKTFAAYRVPRQPAETPPEYVSRVLDRLNVSSWSVRRLTELFQRAKFSSHAIDEGMKEDAIETLAGLREELAVNEAEAA